MPILYSIVFLFRYACKEREEPAACHGGICKLGTRAGFCGSLNLNLCYRHRVILGCSTYLLCLYVNDIEKESTNVSLTKLRIETKPISFNLSRIFFESGTFTIYSKTLKQTCLFVSEFFLAKAERFCLIQKTLKQERFLNYFY